MSLGARTILFALLTCLHAAAVTEPSSAALEAWRTLDRRGAACASCHSPDGIELSVFRFEQKDLVRRASAHLPPEKQQQVLKLVLSGRSRLKTVDPMTERPLQPGGKVLAGKTAADRDDAFLQNLARVVPRLAGEPVRSYEDALAVCREALAVDLAKLPVGLTMNRLSEDGFHGKDHATLAHWIPDVALPLTPEVLAAQDAYLAKPCQATLANLDETVRKGFSPKTPIEYLALAKYRSLLQFQHRLRVNAGLAPQEAHIATPPGNPFWEVGQIGQQFTESIGEQMALPPEMESAKTLGPSVAEQMRAIRVPWFWLGWIADPALMNSGDLPETRRADYFTQALLDDGPYPGHALWMLSRKLWEQSRPGPVTPKTRPWQVQYSFLLLGATFKDREPSDPKAKALFRKIAANAFRTTMWLLRHEIERTKETIVPESQILQVRLMGEYLEGIGEPENALVEKTNKLLASAHAWGRPGR